MLVTEQEISAFLHKHLDYWNSGDRRGMRELYKKYARDSLVIEYVGVPLADGWQTFDHMWETYNGKVRTDIGHILVNGNEGACYYKNVIVETGESHPSIEIYKFTEGSLHIRYFHETSHLESLPETAG
jgi:hypothetical protein